MNTQWNEFALFALISDQIEEADQLEYKSAKSLQKTDSYMDEIGKDVSSFSNSGGGVIIYGIKEFDDKSRKHLPERLDPVDRVQVTREWLEHVINRIQPRIADLRIIPVPLSTGQSHVAYVIEVPKGTTAHQAPSGRYYRRYNFEAQAMKDHEIRDVMNRKKYPSVETEIKIWMHLRNVEAGLFWRVTNTGDVIARHVMTSIMCPHFINGLFLTETKGAKLDSIVDDDDVVYWRLKGSNTLGLPLFPKSELTHVFRFGLSQSVQWDKPVKHLEVIRFRTYADEMPFVSGELNAKENTTIVKGY